MRLPERVIARSASDKTDDWPFWYCAETRASVNITSAIARELGHPWRPGAVFARREYAEALAGQWNARGEAARASS